MTSSSGSSVEPRLALPRSSTTAALWGHLLHKKPHTSLAAKSNGDRPNLVPPMKPVDKAGTSARMLLHDTQAVLEKFSGKIDKLHSEVEQAKNEVSMSHKVFQHGNDKVLSDQVDLSEFGAHIVAYIVANLRKSIAARPSCRNLLGSQHR